MSDREVDQQLVERAQRGDKRAFELLVIKYQRKLERLLSRIIRDPDEIEDVAQEAFVKAYRALPTSAATAPSTPGSTASASTPPRTTWSRWAGARPPRPSTTARRRRASRTPIGLRDINTPENVLMSKQIGKTVNDAIDALPEELRTAITLREIDGLSYEEIAKIMNCPIGTVRSRIFRAREAVAEKLRPQLGTTRTKDGKNRQQGGDNPGTQAPKGRGPDTFGAGS